MKSGAPSLEGLRPDFDNQAGLNTQVLTDWQRLLGAIYVRDYEKQGSSVPNGKKLFMKEVVGATSYSSRLAVLMRQAPWKPLGNRMLDFTALLLTTPGTLLYCRSTATSIAYCQCQCGNVNSSTPKWLR